MNKHNKFKYDDCIFRHQIPQSKVDILSNSSSIQFTNTFLYHPKQIEIDLLQGFEFTVGDSKQNSLQIQQEIKLELITCNKCQVIINQNCGVNENEFAWCCNFCGSKNSFRENCLEFQEIWDKISHFPSIEYSNLLSM